jgi:hypothetical protein
MFDFRRLGLASLVVVCCCTLSGQAQDKEYKIVLTRPSKVGDKAKVSGDITTETRTVISPHVNIPDPAVEAMGVSYEGQSQVDATDEYGKPTKMTVTLEKCVVTTPAGRSEAVPKGAVVTIELKNDHSTFELKGGQLSDEAKAALVMADFVKTPRPVEAEAFATDQPQKVGSQWPINTAAVATGFLRVGLMVDPKSINGQVALVGIKLVNGVPCLHIVAEVNIDHFTPSTAGMFPGFKFDRGVSKCRMTGLFPEDVLLPRIEETQATTSAIDISQTGPNGIPMSIKTTTTVNTNTQVTPIK